jgi:hypothetical protein
MLRDRVRTGAYRDAFIANAHRFKDAVVMDIGAGTPSPPLHYDTYISCWMTFSW